MNAETGRLLFFYEVCISAICTRSSIITLVAEPKLYTPEGRMALCTSHQVDPAWTEVLVMPWYAVMCCGMPSVVFHLWLQCLLAGGHTYIYVASPNKLVVPGQRAAQSSTSLNGLIAKQVSSSSSSTGSQRQFTVYSSTSHTANSVYLTDGGGGARKRPADTQTLYTVETIDSQDRWDGGYQDYHVACIPQLSATKSMTSFVCLLLCLISACSL